MQQRQPLGRLTSSRLTPVSFAHDRERTPSPVRSPTPSDAGENLSPSTALPRLQPFSPRRSYQDVVARPALGYSALSQQDNSAGTSSNPSPQEAQAAAALLGLPAVTPPQSPTRLVTPSAPPRNRDEASSSQASAGVNRPLQFRDLTVEFPITLQPRRVYFGQFPTGGSAAGEGFLQRLRGQTINGEAPRSRSHSPVLGQTSGRDPFARS